MTWPTILLVLVLWCLVSVVAGFAFSFLFLGMTRIHPEERAAGRTRSLRREQQKARKRRIARRLQARARATGTGRPLPAGGAPDPQLEK